MQIKKMYYSPLPLPILISNKKLDPEELKKLSPEEIAENLGLESIEMNGKIKREFLQRFGMENWVENASVVAPPMVICFMGDNVGYGVFSLTYIKKGKCLGVYAGERFPLTEEHKLKGANFDNIKNRPYVFIDAKKGCVIDSRKIGGITRFFQYLPENELMQRYEFSKGAEAIAISNMQVGYQDGITFPLMYVSRDISPFEQLGWSYGGNDLSYSALMAQFCFFYKDGSIVNPADYSSPAITIFICRRDNVRKYEVKRDDFINLYQQALKEDDNSSMVLPGSWENLNCVLLASTVRDVLEKRPSDCALAFKSFELEICEQLRKIFPKKSDSIDSLIEAFCQQDFALALRKMATNKELNQYTKEWFTILAQEPDILDSLREGKTSGGLNALDLAVKYGNKELIDFLKELGLNGTVICQKAPVETGAMFSKPSGSRLPQSTFGESSTPNVDTATTTTTTMATFSGGLI